MFSRTFHQRAFAVFFAAATFHSLAHAQLSTLEIAPGISVSAPVGSTVSFEPQIPGHIIFLPSGLDVGVGVWRLPRRWRSESTSQIARSLRSGNKGVPGLSVRVRGRTILHRRLLTADDEWFYELKYRAKRSEFVEAKTWIPRNNWDSHAAKEARAVVESLRVER